jgi:hypothetical protein
MPPSADNGWGHEACGRTAHLASPILACPLSNFLTSPPISWLTRKKNKYGRVSFTCMYCMLKLPRTPALLPFVRGEKQKNLFFLKRHKTVFKTPLTRNTPSNNISTNIPNVGLSLADFWVSFRGCRHGEAHNFRTGALDYGLSSAVFGNTHIHPRDWTNKYFFDRKSCVVFSLTLSSRLLRILRSAQRGKQQGGPLHPCSSTHVITHHP